MNAPATTERVLPSFVIKEQYLIEYFELLERFKECNKLLYSGWGENDIVNSKVYKRVMVSIVILGEKIRRKMENVNRKKKKESPYTTFLDYLNDATYAKPLSYYQTVQCINTITNFFEDEGYTRLEVANIQPDEAVREWT